MPSDSPSGNGAVRSISQGEVEVYDRQLRLWGVQAQQRLLKSKVLIWGLEGSNVEVCKNLVLAGVTLVLRDHRTVSIADVAFNYFLREDEVGKNRAECTARRVQEMNPFCEVIANTEGPVDNLAELHTAMKHYDVVCLGPGVLGWDMGRVSAAAAACRKAHVGFILTVSAGEIVYFVSDFGNCVVEERSNVQGRPAEAPDQAAELEKVTFPAFSEWLACSAADLQQQKADGVFILLALFTGFLQKKGTALPVEPEAVAAQFADFCRTSKCAPEVEGVSKLEDIGPMFFLEPLVPVAAVLGGLLAQEVIKFITRRDPPLVNCVCFSAHTGAALVERIPAQKVQPKRKAEVSVDLDD
mmetsp:Transcript_20699/g.45443  ORF Transcript_20699/g.45443 Transcript_20699/m.45443 type:complete len:355 (+) Transcript_20699:2-1066(+)